MTEDDLKAIEARANAATPGPWTYYEIRNDNINAINAEFIAHAREDVPALIA